VGSWTGRDGKGYPKPDGFYSIRVHVWVNFLTHGIIHGNKVVPSGVRVQVRSYDTQTRKPMGKIYPVQLYCVPLKS
jgi:hypothetical protein